MRAVIKSAEDVGWLLAHTRAFRGGRISDLHVRKQRVFDEASGRDFVVGTTVTVVIHYDVAVAGWNGWPTVARTARLTMLGATDFSVFEQEGADCSELGTIHAEASDGRLRFWFDPKGELYVVCDEALLDEVSSPEPAHPLRTRMSEWTFQAPTGILPERRWFLDQLDRLGCPCAWRPLKRRGSAHPALRWEGYLVSAPLTAGAGHEGVYVRVYGPVEGCQFVITLRAAVPPGGSSGRLLPCVADLIAEQFEGTCLAGDYVMDGHEWLDGRSVPR
jgi:hypothetical protein